MGQITQVNDWVAEVGNQPIQPIDKPVPCSDLPHSVAFNTGPTSLRLFLFHMYMTTHEIDALWHSNRPTSLRKRRTWSALS